MYSAHSKVTCVHSFLGLVNIVSARRISQRHIYLADVLQR